jgi:threonine dehydrogenase-like Zn-dependent dehydrogenase
MADGQEAAAIQKATAGRGVDVAFECAGHNNAFTAAINNAVPGGRVVIVGIPVDTQLSFDASVVRGKGLTISYQRRSHPVYLRAMRLVQAGLVDLASVVSHEFPLSDAANAFVFAEKRGGLKVVLRP